MAPLAANRTLRRRRAGLALVLLLAMAPHLGAQTPWPVTESPPISVETATPIVTPAFETPIPQAAESPAARGMPRLSGPPFPSSHSPSPGVWGAPPPLSDPQIRSARVFAPPVPNAPVPAPPPPAPASPLPARPVPPGALPPAPTPNPAPAPSMQGQPVTDPQPDPAPASRPSAPNPHPVAPETPHPANPETLVPGPGAARGILVRLPVAQPQPGGTVWLQPNVQPLAAGPLDDYGHGGGELGPGPTGMLPSWDPAAVPGANAWNGEVLPLADPFAQDPCLNCGSNGASAGCGSGRCRSGGAEPVFGRALSRLHGRACDPCGPFAPLVAIFSPANCSGDIGVGRDRLVFAPFELEPSQPQNRLEIGLDLVNNFTYPNRAEYFWAAPGKGPESLDTSVDYQDYRFLSELGSGAFSTTTELFLRSLDPVYQPNTGGLSDMNVATKLVMFDGKRWQWSQIFRTYFNTGAPRKGLGTGHISMEPGLVGTYQWTPITVLHTELKYWFPIAGDPAFSGQVLRYGLGYSHLCLETDAFAIIHTGEFLGLCFQNGQRSTGISGADPYDVDGEGVFHFFPGLRFVADTGGDCGLFEFGISGTLGMGRDVLYDGLLRFDFRWSY